MSESPPDDILSDAPPPPKRGRPRKARQDHRKGKQRGVGRRPFRARSSPEETPPAHTPRFQANVELTETDALRLDAYRDALAHDSRAQAARELILAALARHEQRQHVATEEEVTLQRRIALAWWFLCGKAPSVVHRTIEAYRRGLR